MSKLSCCQIQGRLNVFRQEILKKLSLDCVLCITGVDCGFDFAGKHVVDFLFLEPLKERPKRPMGRDEDNADDLMEDLIVCIKADVVHVYCNFYNYEVLCSVLGSLPDVHIYCLTKTQYKDSEKSEAYKIEALAMSVAGCKNVGIPVYKHDEKFDPMVIEQWPLIQAYALDEVGSRGFFTMAHSVTNVFKDVEALMTTYFDSPTMVSFVKEDMQAWLKHWTDILALFRSHGFECIDMARDILVEYCTYLSAHKQNKLDIEMQPRLEKFAPGNQVTVCIPHPRLTPLAAARTYFAEGKVTKVTKLYDLLIRVVQKVVSGWNPKDGTWPTQQNAAAILVELGMTLGLSADYATKMSSPHHFSFEVSGREHFAFVKAMPVCVSAKLINLPHPNHPEQNIGDVVYADSYIYIMQGEDHKVTPFNFTNCVPRYFHVSVPELPSLVEKLKEATHSDVAEARQGPKLDELTVMEHCLIAYGGKSVTDKRAATWDDFFSTKLLFRLGTAPTHFLSNPFLVGGSIEMLVDPQKGGSICVYHKGATNHPVLLFFPSANPGLLIGIPPKTKSFRLLFDTLIPAWMSLPNVKVHQLDTLASSDEKLASWYTKLCFHTAPELASCVPTPDILTETLLGKITSTSMTRAMVFTNADVTHKNVETFKTFDCTKFESVDENVVRKENLLPVTVICGLPQSHRSDLSRNIVSVTKENHHWSSVRVANKAEDQAFSEIIENFLSTTRFVLKKVEEKAQHHKPSEFDSLERILVEFPGLYRVQECLSCLVETIQNDEKLCGKVFIANVVYCLDPHTLFLRNRRLFPQLIEDFRPGFVNTIMLTRNVRSTEEQILLKFLKSANSHCDIVRCPNAGISSDAHIQSVLKLSDFVSDNSAFHRLVANPSWLGAKTGTVSKFPTPILEKLTVNVNFPLNKDFFVNAICKLWNRFSDLDIGESADFVVYFVSGVVSFADDAKEGKVFQEEISVVVPSGDQVFYKVAGRQAKLTFWGHFKNDSENEASNNVQAWLNSSVLTFPEPLPIYQDIKSIPKATIERIHTTRHVEKLPEGWYYNGAQFLDLGSGDRRNMHPALPDWLEEWRKAHNEKATKFNMQLEETKKRVYFEPEL